MITRKPYPSDISDDEWAFVVPYLTVMNEQAPQRQHDLREIFNRLRWLDAGCFEMIGHDLREVLRQAQGRDAQPKAALFDGRTLQSRCESGTRAGYDGYQRRKGSKVHMAVDTLDHLLALRVTPANERRSPSSPKPCRRLPETMWKWHS